MVLNVKSRNHLLITTMLSFAAAVNLVIEKGKKNIAHWRTTCLQVFINCLTHSRFIFKSPSKILVNSSNAFTAFFIGPQIQTCRLNQTHSIHSSLQSINWLKINYPSLDSWITSHSCFCFFFKWPDEGPCISNMSTKDRPTVLALSTTCANLVFSRKKWWRVFNSRF